MMCSCGRPGASKVNEDLLTGKFDVLPCIKCRQEQLDAARARREKEALKHLTLSGVPKIFRGAKLSDFPDNTVDPSMNYYIHGESGIGKTHLLAAHLRANVLHGTRCFFCSEADMTERLRPTCPEKSRLSMPFLMDVPLLYLDDVGIVKPTEWALQNLESIVDKRYADGKRTLLSSNHPLDEFAEIVGERIASRIHGTCEVLFLMGNDRRVCAGPGR